MNETPKDAAELKVLNRWLWILIIFMVVWSGALLYNIDKKSDQVSTRPVPVVMMDYTTGKITNILYTNLFLPPFVSGASKKTADTPKPMYEQKESYQRMEFVIINYFFIEGLVLEREGDYYKVMYKDHDRVLQTVTLPKEMLLSPTSYNGVNPFSLQNP